MAGRPSLYRMSFVFMGLGEFSSDVHKDFFAPNLGRVTGDSHIRVLNELPCGHVIFPAVPRTGNNFILERPLSQRPSSMEASVIDGVKLVAYISERHSLAI